MKLQRCPRAILLAAALLSPAARAAQSADIYLTARDSGERLTKTATTPLAPAGASTEKQAVIIVDPAKSFQTIVGIGGALTDASAETYAKLPEAKRAEFIRAYYDPKDGIGYTLGRTNIHSCDFSSDMYTYVADGDTELKSFSVAHDEQFRIPLIRAALQAAGGKLTLFASPWSPPAWMKDNDNMLHGGKLKPEFRDTWARYVAAFVKTYEKAGIPIWGVTVQNEPMAVQKWESCVFSAEDERDFVRDHLGPVFAQSGLGDKKIIVWDHNRTWMYQRAQVILDDPAAAKYVWGVGFHWYVEDGYQNTRLVKQAYPQTHLLFTEGCNYPYERAKLGDWNWGEKYGEAMINDFNNGTEGWTDWNILLDEKGGPNHVANYCYAPVHADTKTGELIYMNSFYYIGHFSKFVRPGAKRIVSAATTDQLETTAFQNTDGSLAIVVMNSTEKAQKMKVVVGADALSSSSPPHSIMTVVVRSAP
jgi:glucosylceramidase